MQCLSELLVIASEHTSHKGTVLALTIKFQKTASLTWQAQRMGAQQGSCALAEAGAEPDKMSRAARSCGMQEGDWPHRARAEGRQAARRSHSSCRRRCAARTGLGTPSASAACCCARRAMRAWMSSSVSAASRSEACAPPSPPASTALHSSSMLKPAGRAHGRAVSMIPQVTQVRVKGQHGRLQQCLRAVLPTGQHRCTRASPLLSSSQKGCSFHSS